MSKLVATIKFVHKVERIYLVTQKDWNALWQENLHRAILEGLQIVKVNFDSIDISGASITDGLISRCTFRTGWLFNSEWVGCHITDTCFDHTDLSGAYFLDCHLERVTFVGANLELTTFQNCHFIETDFTNSILKKSKVESSDFDPTTKGPTFFDPFSTGHKD